VNDDGCGAPCHQLMIPLTPVRSCKTDGRL
jgi:hypothetical protein